MLEELIDRCEDYFSLKENLLILRTFFDILDIERFLKGIETDKIAFNVNAGQCKVIDVKLYLSPMVDDAITQLIRMLSSEEQILSLIYNEDSLKLNLWHQICGLTATVLERILQLDCTSLIPKHLLAAMLLKAKVCNLLTRVILRFHELAGPELANSFRMYREITKTSLSRHTLFGGIVYFIYIVCLETFTTGLNEFLRISLIDLDNIVDLDPTLSVWSPELRLIRIILELHNRCDQNAIDCMLQFVIFEIEDISAEFLGLLKSSLKLLKTSEIPLELIHRFGNKNLVEFFENSIEMFVATNYFSTTDLLLDDLRQSWADDFVFRLNPSE